MDSKFRYVLFPDNIYKIATKDYDGNPYLFEISGRDIIERLRRDILLEKRFDEIDKEVWAKPIDIVPDSDTID